MSTSSVSEITYDLPPFDKYQGQDSYFGGEPPLSEGVGYLVVLGFGALFSVITTALVWRQRRCYLGALQVRRLNLFSDRVRFSLTNSNPHFPQYGRAKRQDRPYGKCDCISMDMGKLPTMSLSSRTLY
jgi:hypothetical protein